MIRISARLQIFTYKDQLSSTDQKHSADLSSQVDGSKFLTYLVDAHSLPTPLLADRPQCHSQTGTHICITPLPTGSFCPNTICWNV